MDSDALRSSQLPADFDARSGNTTAAGFRDRLADWRVLPKTIQTGFSIMRAWQRSATT
jgi:hypothetical protein